MTQVDVLDVAVNRVAVVAADRDAERGVPDLGRKRIPHVRQSLACAWDIERELLLAVAAGRLVLSHVASMSRMTGRGPGTRATRRRLQVGEGQLVRPCVRASPADGRDGWA